MIDIGARVRLMGGPITGTLIGHTFYKRASFATVEPGYVVLLDEAFRGFIDSKAGVSHYTDTCVAHPTSLEEIQS